MSQPLDKKAGERQRGEVLRLKANSYEEIAREALEIAEDATEGPWYVRRDTSVDGSVQLESRRVGPVSRAVLRGINNYPTGTPEGSQENFDLTFVAYARKAVPDLAKAVLEQKETIERLQSELSIEKASQATRGNT